MKINNHGPDGEIKTRNATGFGSPATEFEEVDLSGKLTSIIVPRPSSTYYFKIGSDSMSPSILNGDLLIVDRSINPKTGSLCVCAYQGKFIIRTLVIFSGGIFLKATNPRIKEIRIVELNDLEIFGVVISIIRNLKG